MSCFAYFAASPCASSDARSQAASHKRPQVFRVPELELAAVPSHEVRPPKE